MQNLFLLLGIVLLVSLALSYFLRGKQVKQSIRDLLNISKQRVSKLLSEFRRKTFHLVGLLVPGIYYYGLKFNFLGKQKACLIVGVLGFLSLSIDLLRLNSKKFNEFILNRLGHIMRKKESARISGSTYYMIGSFFTMVLFNPTIAIVSLLFLDLGDLAAAMVGIPYGRTKIYHGKSLEGSIACFLVCVIIGISVFSHHIRLYEYITVFGALAATLTELFLDQINDNLTIPLISGLIMTLAQLRLNVQIPLP
jgi:dolichol kinase